MKNKRMIDSWNKVKPDDLAQERMLQNITSRSAKRKIIMYWKPFAAIAVACLVLLAGVFIRNIDRVDTKNNTSSEGKTANLSQLSNEIKGLPVKNFKLTDLKLDMTADRMVFCRFTDFFEYHEHSFVIVKVAKTKVVQANGSDAGDKQVSTVKTLKTVLGEKLPATLNLTQYLYGGCTGDEVTNLLREGGVYLLPIVKHEGEYYLGGDLDVLFEIDNQGKIWSHSDYTDFNRYDGKDYQVVTNHIISMSQEDNLKLATSSFGRALRDSQLLEVTVIADPKRKKVEYGGTESIYTTHVERVLSGEQPKDELLIGTDNDEMALLKKGERYLLFVYTYKGKLYMNSYLVASVNKDGTISNLEDEGRAFEDYNGYTVDKISELALKVAKFFKTYE